jgi:hypothetical protein
VDCFVLDLFYCRRHGRSGDGCSALGCGGNAVVYDLFCHATSAGIMNSYDVDIVIDQFERIFDCVEALNASKEDLDAEELQIWTPFDVDKLLVLGRDTQQDLLDVRAVGEKLDAPQKNRSAGDINERFLSLAAEPAARPCGTNNCCNLLVHNESPCHTMKIKDQKSNIKVIELIRRPF